MTAGRASAIVLVASLAVVPWITTPMPIGAAYAIAAVLGVGVLLWMASLLEARAWPFVDDDPIWSACAPDPAWPLPEVPADALTR